ncbi:DEAD/DEAH box helicase [Paraconexibacter antarcticus]|uniref:DEAD/DEAH box helicase n=1 Tax=Paraconexibacter antarcticus TaxID=2949664 RepID=A0ABY5DN26_9ACTN|nr:DEAD/DEAH box helicase [Paraconexibacter antarcticus]UTI63408.1 DEAD/DEAH box helicase [Paraconexibacter antarcticus]
MTPSFADLGVSEIVSTTLAKQGFTAPFAIQNLVIADVLAGRDVLAKSPTGSGKTLAFGIPVVDRIEATDRRPSALVLAPTRELASQIVEDLRPLAHARALSICAVYGGVGIQKQARDAAKSHIVVATPGRLEDLLQRRAISLSHVKVLVLDEADRMLDMGFKPAVDRIVNLCPSTRQTLFFSATLDGEAGRVAKAYTQDAAQHEHTPVVDPKVAARIEHRFLSVVHEHKLRVLTDELRRERDLALVFVRTKRGADRLVQRLVREGIDAVAMHGDKTQKQREKALARFEAGNVDVLVATDVAARGIDVAGVSHVINFDPPEDREGYVHRIGRTGRAGRRGVGITFVMSDQARDVGAIAHDLDLATQFAKSGLRGGGGQHGGPARSGGSGGGGGGSKRPARPKSRSGKGHTGPSERNNGAGSGSGSGGGGFRGGSFGSQGGSGRSSRSSGSRTGGRSSSR